MKKKERLDTALVRLGHFSSRERAQAAILEGNVFVDDRPVQKAGTPVTPESRITLKKEDHPYVSRGGLKLAEALRQFKVSAQDKTVLDVGSSTGGFIDCLLQSGAAAVIGVDVGYGQLAWSLRNNPKVKLMERKNIRHLHPEELPCQTDLITVDVSFISVKKITAVLRTLVKTGGDMIILVKPQFEAARGKAKKGIIKDEQDHIEVLTRLLEHFADTGLSVQGLIFSPLTGAEGNLEFLVHLRADTAQTALVTRKEIEKTVREAHRVLLKDKQGTRRED